MRCSLTAGCICADADCTAMTKIQNWAQICAQFIAFNLWVWQCIKAPEAVCEHAFLRRYMQITLTKVHVPPQFYKILNCKWKNILSTYSSKQIIYMRLKCAMFLSNKFKFCMPLRIHKVPGLQSWVSSCNQAGEKQFLEHWWLFFISEATKKKPSDLFNSADK